MGDEAEVYFKSCELASIRHVSAGPLGFSIFDGSTRQGTWRLAEAILESIAITGGESDQAPGLAMFMGRDLGPLLGYLAHILQQTKIYGLMDNQHIADHARHWLREQDLVMRVPVFSGNSIDPASYRIMKQIPWFFSIDTLLSCAEFSTVLAVVAERMPSEGILWASGYFPGTAPETESQRKAFEMALRHVDLQPNQVRTAEVWASVFSHGGFIAEKQTMVAPASFGNVSSTMRLLVRRLLGVFQKPYEKADETWKGEVALMRALKLGLLRYGWMQFRKT